MDFHFETVRPLCRPRMLPDEWVETYLFRVARANGIRRPRLREADYLRQTLVATAGSKPDGYPLWSDITLPRWSVVTRVNRIRYCPACMVESRHIRSRWRLKLFEICTIHYIRLKDDLAEPVMTRGYSDSGRHFVTEVTDEQMWEGAVCPMPGERRYVERMWSGFERSIVEDDARSAIETLPFVLLLDALFDAVVARTSGRRSLRSGIPRTADFAELVERFEYSVAPDLDGVRTLLRLIKAARHRCAALTRLRRMLMDETDRPTCLSSLPLAELRMVLLNSRRKKFVKPTRSSADSYQARREGYTSFRNARLLIGCTSDCLRHLARSEFLPGMRVVPPGQKRCTDLPLRWVEACRRWYASHATRETVMKELHIDRSVFSVLVRAGMFCSVEVGAYRFVSRNLLADLCQRMRDMSRPYPATATRLYPLFGSLLSMAGSRSTISTELLKEAFAGKFPVYRRTGAPGLSAFFVDEIALERARKLKRFDAAWRRHQTERPSQFELALQ
ncbi:TniQ protein [Paraburkholderia megapolitana]|uniref:TniQ protein n=2 Tax=Paraburkholderia megapolitana TaxID=420953 RepID=A0A1I3UPR2_9BURK|nr:TniQ protein [Paraburkholderia megapolitana]